jgi:hypothetical protein
MAEPARDGFNREASGQLLLAVSSAPPIGTRLARVTDRPYTDWFRPQFGGTAPSDLCEFIGDNHANRYHGAGN